MESPQTRNLTVFWAVTTLAAIGLIPVGMMPPPPLLDRPSLFVDAASGTDGLSVAMTKLWEERRVPRRNKVDIIGEEEDDGILADGGKRSQLDRVHSHHETKNK